MSFGRAVKRCILFHCADFEVQRRWRCETPVACFSSAAASGFQDAVSLVLPIRKGRVGLEGRIEAV